MPELLDAGAAPAEVAVLARVNASLAPVQVLLRSRGVPVDGGVSQSVPPARRGQGGPGLAGGGDGPGQALPGPVLREVARRPKRGMSASLLDLVSRKGSVEDLTALAGVARGARAASGKQARCGTCPTIVARVRRAAAAGTTADVLAVLRSQIGDGGLDASATALDQWSHGAGSAHGDDLDALPSWPSSKPTRPLPRVAVRAAERPGPRPAG